MKACVPDGFPPHPTAFPRKNHKTSNGFSCFSSCTQWFSLKTMAHNSFISFYLICSLPQPSQSFSSYTSPSSLIDLNQAPLSPHLPATSHLLMMEAAPASCLMLGSHEFHCKINGLTWYLISKSHEFHCKINGFRWCLMPKPHGFHGKTNGLTWYLIPKPHEFHCKTNGCSWSPIPKPHKAHRKSHQLHCKILIFEPPTRSSSTYSWPLWGTSPIDGDGDEPSDPLMLSLMALNAVSCNVLMPS